MGENLREEFRSDQSSGFFRILPISLAVTEKISNFDIDLEVGTDSSNDSFIRIHCDRFPLLSAVRAANKKKKKKSFASISFIPILRRRASATEITRMRTNETRGANYGANFKITSGFLIKFNGLLFDPISIYLRSSLIYSRITHLLFFSFISFLS